MGSNLKKCSICIENGKFQCGNCKITNYCSKEHQKIHWKIHKHNCFPVTYGWDSIRGNELIATRDIKQGEIILKEKPVMSGPSGKTDTTYSICIGCYNVLMNQSYLCSKCKWPLCNISCEKEPLHSDIECEIFTKYKIPPFKHNQQYEYLFIIRCLYLKIINPIKWEEFKKFESHMEERDCNLMESLLIHTAIEFIQNTCKMNINFEENEIKFVSGVINTNAMGHGDFQTNIPGKIRKCGSYLYLLGCLICHSCTPNVYRVIQNNGELHVRAIIPIKIGEPLLTTYTDLAMTTQERGSYLSSFYYFSCTCPRCTDPTELGTYFSAIKCTSSSCCQQKQPYGYILPKNPLDNESEWLCNNINCTLSPIKSNILQLLNNIKNELDMIGKDYTENCIEQLELYIKKHVGITLHPNHALIYRAEYDIIQRMDYMISASLIINPLIRNQLIEKQIYLIRRALNLMSSFWPGYSSYRGRLLYFLQNALLRLTLSKVAKNLKENKRSSSEKFLIQQSMEEILKVRKEAADILSFDPPGKDEHMIAERIKSTDSPEFQIAMKYCMSSS